MTAFGYRLRTRPPLVCVEDYRAAARRALPTMVWAYLDGGAEDERTLYGNRTAFTNWSLRQRVLAGHSGADIGVELFGERLDLPVLLSPTGLTGLAHWTGELGAARAAEQAGTRLTLSTASSYSIEEVATGTRHDHWFQLYPWGERAGFMTSMLDRARDSGYRTLVVTVDVPVQGNRVGERRTGMGHPPILTPRRIADAAVRPGWWYGLLRHRRMTMANVTGTRGAAGAVESVAVQQRQIRPDLTWADVAALRDRWEGPFVVKGILDPADAQRAVQIGATGVVVSNHGGRQLNPAVPSLAALPAVVDAVGDRATVLLDGGVRSGSDAVTALALGADAVMVGRPCLYGLAVAGADGVAAVLGILAAEIRQTLTLMGVGSVADLSRDHLIAMN
ncbi:alpha-hydroxy acid oxidase [Mycolicibacterium diernhoferi]|uniref:Alpha-hydroxy-acid oxidizing enzyme n=1 Tax=Mycolicibacterium diernhoferi TaxID=1801 RepID=A0A1Q4H8Z3_9MYCO|nr:alpha-hydroxy acid oxidase [Mycolicibacterium diernhoferi]OJZ63987.1 alpha-hydroxy-acid oxidizing enzyme [Mycolicibacterium diernhoferi]OPE54142.1 alpha-hydroxy-acid oxidizing enzyme [Mycolicibacterium diernhoferi]PEG55629.1 alpha-hydroxy-acid oxidizing protein [Mycolicibacterium diernhoferi]QYL20675.1 alpha-hydroxy-acid oxidizing protein [Mycolicibacterium diernhoferi]